MLLSPHKTQVLVMDQKITRRRGACQQCKHRKIRCEFASSSFCLRVFNAALTFLQGNGEQPACGRCYKKSLKCQYQNPRRASVAKNLPNMLRNDCSLLTFDALNAVELDLFLPTATELSSDLFDSLDFEVMSQFESTNPLRDQEGYEESYLGWAPDLNIGGDCQHASEEEALNYELQYSLFPIMGIQGSESGSCSSRNDEVSTNMQTQRCRETLRSRSKISYLMLNIPDE
jgi:hypothetical protein